MLIIPKFQQVDIGLTSEFMQIRDAQRYVKIISVPPHLLLEKRVAVDPTCTRTFPECYGTLGGCSSVVAIGMYVLRSRACYKVVQLSFQSAWIVAETRARAAKPLSTSPPKV